MASGVYVITTKHECGLYIGSAVNLTNRIAEHKRDLRKNQHHNSWLQKIYNKYGADNLQFAVVSFCDKDQLISKEQFFIEKIGFDNLYNLQPTAGSNLGMKYPPEFGRAVSKRCKGVKRNGSSWLGRKHTESSKAKMSAQRKGRKLKPGTIEKIRLANTGKKRSPEFCKKMSKINKDRKILNYQPRPQEMYDRIGLANKGKKRSDEAKRKMSEAKLGKLPSNTGNFKLVNPDGVVVEGFNLKEFARSHNLNYICLHLVVRGKQREHKGWRATVELPPPKKKGGSSWKARPFKLLNPEGKLIEGINVRKFAQDNNLSYQGLIQVLGGRQISSRGWRKAP